MARVGGGGGLLVNSHEKNRRVFFSVAPVPLRMIHQIARPASVATSRRVEVGWKSILLHPRWIGFNQGG